MCTTQPRLGAESTTRSEHPCITGSTDSRTRSPADMLHSSQSAPECSRFIWRELRRLRTVRSGCVTENRSCDMPLLSEPMDPCECSASKTMAAAYGTDRSGDLDPSRLPGSFLHAMLPGCVGHRTADRRRRLERDTFLRRGCSRWVAVTSWMPASEGILIGEQLWQVSSELSLAKPYLKLVSRIVITVVGGLHAAMHCKIYMTD